MKMRIAPKHFHLKFLVLLLIHWQLQAGELTSLPHQQLFESTQMQLIELFFWGIAGGCGLLALLLALSFRQACYALYLLLILCSSIGLAWWHGALSLGTSNPRGLPISFALSLLCLSGLLQSIQIELRPLSKIWSGWFLALFFMLILAIVLPVQHLSFLLTSQIVLAIALLISQHKASFASARYWQLSVLALILGGLAYQLFDAIFALYISAASQFLLLGLAFSWQLSKWPACASNTDDLIAQQRLLDQWQSSERLLEEYLRLHTVELSANHQILLETNAELNLAYEEAEIARQAAEHAQREVTKTLDQLRATEWQLVQSEKMAALGQLVSGVAHEINTPIATMKLSGANIAEAIRDVLHNTPRLFRKLNSAELDLFFQLIWQANHSLVLHSTRAERQLVRDTERQLELLGLHETRHTAAVLVQLAAHKTLENYLPLLQHKECRHILASAHNVATVIHSTNNINTAVDRVSKILFALKSYSHFDAKEVKVNANLREGLETVLTIFNTKFDQQVVVDADLQDLPPILCLPDELRQAWGNLIQNALQAMQPLSNQAGYQAELQIRLWREQDTVHISFRDNGIGIPAENLPKIFEAFFTTKAAGEASGLGLGIVKKIIQKHRGEIEVSSEVGKGTCVSISLPYDER